MAVPPAGTAVSFRGGSWVGVSIHGGMPTYCYRDDAGELVELTMTVSEMSKREVDGVIAHEGRLLTRDVSAEHCGARGNAFCGAKWPIESDAAGCHPSEIPTAMADMRKRGVALNFTSDGRAIFESHAHRRAALRAMGMHDRGGYA
jgi:hypothetical protein